MEIEILSETEIFGMFSAGTIPPPPKGEGARLIVFVTKRAVQVGWYGVVAIVSASISTGEPGRWKEIAGFGPKDLPQLHPSEMRADGFRLSDFEAPTINLKLDFADGSRLATVVDLEH